MQSESVIIQKLYTHFKKCPGTHKLGPLYVVDSIARRYLENAKKNGQEVSATAPDGTFAAGVYRITNLLPMLMVDILRHAPPEDNKVRWFLDAHRGVSYVAGCVRSALWNGGGCHECHMHINIISSLGSMAHATLQCCLLESHLHSPCVHRTRLKSCGKYGNEAVRFLQRC